MAKKGRAYIAAVYMLCPYCGGDVSEDDCRGLVLARTRRDTMPKKNSYPEAIAIVCEDDIDSRALLVEICKRNPHAVVNAHRHIMGAWRVILDDHGHSKILCIKTIREITGFGLKEGKVLSETPGVILIDCLSPEAAVDVLAKLSSAGAVAHIERG